MAVVKAPKRVEPKTLSDLKQIGFVEAPSEVTNKRAIVSIASIDKEGKTDLALSGPPPVYYIDIDVGGTGILERFKAAGKEIYVYKLRFIKEGVDQKLWEEQWEGFREVFVSALGLNEGTVIVDTASEMYELCRLARLGRLEQVPPLKYVEVNKEMRELLRMAYESTMNVVLVHKMKAEWIGGQKTTNFEIVGWSDTEYNTQLNLRPYTAEEKDNKGEPVTHFWVKVRNCRMNARMTGKKYYCGKAGDPPGGTLEKLISEMYRGPTKKLKLDEDEDEEPKKKSVKKSGKKLNLDED